MTLGRQQERFAYLLAMLIQRAHLLRFEVRLGELERTLYQAEEYERLGVGTRRSAHCNKLAIDLALFRDGKWLRKTEHYRELGEWWEQQDEACRWGGNFSKSDGGHFSMRHRGVA